MDTPQDNEVTFRYSKGCLKNSTMGSKQDSLEDGGAKGNSMTRRPRFALPTKYTRLLMTISTVALLFGLGHLCRSSSGASDVGHLHSLSSSTDSAYGGHHVQYFGPFKRHMGDTDIDNDGESHGNGDNDNNGDVSDIGNNEQTGIAGETGNNNENGDDVTPDNTEVPEHSKRHRDKHYDLEDEEDDGFDRADFEASLRLTPGDHEHKLPPHLHRKAEKLSNYMKDFIYSKDNTSRSHFDTNKLWALNKYKSEHSETPVESVKEWINGELEHIMPGISINATLQFVENEWHDVDQDASLKEVNRWPEYMKKVVLATWDEFGSFLFDVVAKSIDANAVTDHDKHMEMSKSGIADTAANRTTTVTATAIAAAIGPDSTATASSTSPTTTTLSTVEPRDRSHAFGIQNDHELAPEPFNSRIRRDVQGSNLRKRMYGLTQAEQKWIRGQTWSCLVLKYYKAGLSNKQEIEQDCDETTTKMVAQTKVGKCAKYLKLEKTSAAGHRRRTKCYRVMRNIAFHRDATAPRRNRASASKASDNVPSGLSSDGSTAGSRHARRALPDATGNSASTSDNGAGPVGAVPAPSSQHIVNKGTTSTPSSLSSTGSDSSASDFDTSTADKSSLGSGLTSGVVTNLEVGSAKYANGGATESSTIGSSSTPDLANNSNGGFFSNSAAESDDATGEGPNSSGTSFSDESADIASSQADSPYDNVTGASRHGSVDPEPGYASGVGVTPSSQYSQSGSASEASPDGSASSGPTFYGKSYNPDVSNAGANAAESGPFTATTEGSDDIGDLADADTPAGGTVAAGIVRDFTSNGIGGSTVTGTDSGYNTDSSGDTSPDGSTTSFTTNKPAMTGNSGSGDMAGSSGSPASLDHSTSASSFGAGSTADGKSSGTSSTTKAPLVRRKGDSKGSGGAGGFFSKAASYVKDSAQACIPGASSSISPRTTSSGSDETDSGSTASKVAKEGLNSVANSGAAECLKDGVTGSSSTTAADNALDTAEDNEGDGDSVSEASPTNVKEHTGSSSTDGSDVPDKKPSKKPTSDSDVDDDETGLVSEDDTAGPGTSSGSGARGSSRNQKAIDNDDDGSDSGPTTSNPSTLRDGDNEPETSPATGKTPSGTAPEKAGTGKGDTGSGSSSSGSGGSNSGTSSFGGSSTDKTGAKDNSGSGGKPSGGSSASKSESLEKRRTPSSQTQGQDLGAGNGVPAGDDAVGSTGGTSLDGTSGSAAAAGTFVASKGGDSLGSPSDGAGAASLGSNSSPQVSRVRAMQG